MGRAVAMLSALACVSALAQAPFSESVTVEVMNVDVVALDRNGVAVGGLRAEDFELRVNGQPVAITNFSAYDEAAGTELALESAPATAPAPAPKVVEAPPPVTWLLYVDLTHTIRNRRKNALDQIEGFLRNGGFRRNDRILVAVFQGDAFRVLQPLTGDLKAAGAAIQTIRNTARASREFAPVDMEDPPEGALDEDEKERRIRVALNGIRDLTTVVDGIEGRVALFMVSGGYHFYTFTSERARRLRTVYEKAMARVVEGRITVYSLYAGVEAGDHMNPTVVDPEDNVLGGLDSFSELAAFADETGGIAFKNNAPNIARVRSDLDRYYSLGFRPPARAPGSRLDVDVRVKRDGVRARHRDAVRRRTEAEAAHDVTMTALISDKPPANPWKLEVRIPEIRRNGITGYRAKVEVVVPLAQMLLVEQNGRHAGRLLFHFAVRDADGYFRRLEQRELPLNISSEEVAAARGKSIRYGVDLILPAGTNDLSVTVADYAGAGRSTVRAPIVVARR